MAGETREEKALRAAATGPRAHCREVRQEIRRNQLLVGHDPEGRPVRLERLVAHIEDHLFDESLTVRGACKAVGIADTGIAVDLRAYHEVDPGTPFDFGSLPLMRRIGSGDLAPEEVRRLRKRLGELYPGANRQEDRSH